MSEYFFIAGSKYYNIIMELNIMYSVTAHKKIFFIKQNYKYYHNIY